MAFLVLQNRTHRGFTLIELLVVIAIISLLSSVILTGLQSARIKGRDSERLQEMKQIQNALELYRSTNGNYPTTANWACFDCGSYINEDVTGPVAAIDIKSSLASYLSRTPTDPKGLGGDAGYLYTGNSKGYCFMVYKTPENLKNFPARFINPHRCGGIDSNGQCNANGASGDLNKSIFIGSGTNAAGTHNYETQGC